MKKKEIVMNKEEFLLTYKFLIENEELSDEDILYLTNAIEILIPFAFKEEGNTKETAIPMNCVHNEYLALKLVYLDYKRIRQELYKDEIDNKFYDILTVDIFDNKQIKIWFDINDFYPKVYLESR